MKMKYLIMEDFAGQPVLFVFPNRVNHGDMRDQLPYGQLLSAGYVSLQNGAFVCSGGCAELGYAARPEDNDIITKAFSCKE